MLVEMAIGDAYGAAFEFMDDAFIAHENDLSGYKRNPETGLGDGLYTDDTQMSVAIAEHLLSGAAIAPDLLADRFVATFKRDERRGYSKRLFHTLQEAADGAGFLAAIAPISDRSGAAMRVSPLGLLPDLDRVLEGAALQASLTHDTPGGRMSACAVATMVHYLSHDLGPRPDLGRFIEAHVPGHPWAQAWQGRVDMAGLSCAHAAISLVERSESLSAVLKGAVAFGGDTDTVAAIAMFSASLCRDMAADLPPALYDDLEDGPYGRRFLAELDERLARTMARTMV